MSRAGAFALVVSSVALAGCSSGSHQANSTTTSTSTSASTTSAQQSTRRSLRLAVRAALRSNDKLSGVVLWTNRVPQDAAKSTRGPALVALRTAAAQRLSKHLRIRTVSSKLQILSIKLDPSYARATAVVRSRQVVRPYRAGAPLGRAVKLDERARVELHRLGSETSFVVWRVVGLR
jgi:outer membrane murein-binding lipoprotein Lpp